LTSGFGFTIHWLYYPKQEKRTLGVFLLLGEQSWDWQHI
jgi:hypothetical protein